MPDYTPRDHVTIPLEPSGPGFWVYVIRQGQDVLYVGQSVSPYSRIGTHLTTWARKFKDLEADLIVCYSKREMDDTERELIVTLEPRYNVVGRRGQVDHGYQNRRPFDPSKEDLKTACPQNGPHQCMGPYYCQAMLDSLFPGGRNHHGETPLEAYAFDQRIRRVVGR